MDKWLLKFYGKKNSINCTVFPTIIFIFELRCIIFLCVWKGWKWTHVEQIFQVDYNEILLSLEVTYSMCELFLNILGQIIRIWVFSIFLRFIYYCTTLFYFEMHTFYCGSWYDAKFLLIVAVTPLYYPQNIYTYIYFMLC